METGMADFAHRAAIAKTAPYLDTITEYDFHCHYIAGLVGEGLSRLWAATGKEQPHIADQLVLSNSLGLLLQKINTIRDFREDCHDRRYFWPQEIWGRYGFVAQEDMSKEVNEKKVLRALSEMILDALSVSRRSIIWRCSGIRLFSTFALSHPQGYRYPRTVLYEPRRFPTEYQDSTRRAVRVRPPSS